MKISFQLTGWWKVVLSAAAGAALVQRFAMGE